MTLRSSARARILAITLATVATLVASSLVASAGTVTWSISKSPKITSGYANLASAISCVNPGDVCYAAGWVRNGAAPLIEHKSASNVWTVVPVHEPKVFGQTALDSISCATASFCIAGGFEYVNEPTGYEPVVVMFRGSSWNVAVLAGLSGAQVDSVSCPTPTFCAVAGAVGTTLGNQKEFVDDWNGTSWSIAEYNKLAPSSGGGQLNSVSCPTSSFCLAVGYFSLATGGSGGREAGAEVWNGSTWSTGLNPTEPSTLSGFLFVSCPGANECVAIGQPGRNIWQGPYFTDTWGVAGWTSLPASAAPPTAIAVHGLDCTSATTCYIAAKSSTKSPIPHEPLDLYSRSAVLGWNGTKWSAFVIPQAGDHHVNKLFGISCVTGSPPLVCIAAGQMLLSGNPVPESSAKTSPFFLRGAFEKTLKP